METSRMVAGPRLTLAVLIFAMLTGCAPGQVSDAVPPNIVLVTVDTLRADHLGLYGYPYPTSPHIDALAEEATVFEAHRGRARTPGRIVCELDPCCGWQSAPFFLDLEIDRGYYPLS